MVFYFYKLCTAYQGDVVGQIYQGNRVFDVTVILDANQRQSITSVDNLPLRNATGAYIMLRQLADIYEKSGHFSVLHDGARREQTITCNVTGSDVKSFVGQVKQTIAR